MTSFAQQRFSILIASLNEITKKAKRSNDLASAYYKADARNVIFRLEALCRIYRHISDKKFFETWYRDFKTMEDWLGSLDHNEAMHNEFSSIREWKASANSIFGARYNEELKTLESKLNDEGWLSGEKMKTFSAGLDEQEWSDEMDDREDYALHIIEELEKLGEKYDEGELDPFDLEHGIHEIRRKLRWISIYAVSANGLIQLRKSNVMSEHLKDYCTDNIVNSPFCVMPPVIKTQHPVYIQSTHFYALSWMIQYLGDLKDLGLRYEAAKELSRHSGKGPAVLSRFKKALPIDPADIGGLAEIGIDDFFYRDRIPQKIARDILRTLPA
ncbi:MAG: hypothetical protein JNM00_16150 [Flavobacteriales bacterium]|nr:hypothetical protein [Flavobacteriales bacterium]